MDFVYTFVGKFPIFKQWKKIGKEDRDNKL